MCAIRRVTSASGSGRVCGNGGAGRCCDEVPVIVRIEEVGGGGGGGGGGGIKEMKVLKMSTGEEFNCASTASITRGYSNDCKREAIAG